MKATALQATYTAGAAKGKKGNELIQFLDAEHNSMVTVTINEAIAMLEKNLQTARSMIDNAKDFELLELHNRIANSSRGKFPSPPPRPSTHKRLSQMLLSSSKQKSRSEESLPLVKTKASGHLTHPASLGRKAGMPDTHNRCSLGSTPLRSLSSSELTNSCTAFRRKSATSIGSNLHLSQQSRTSGSNTPYTPSPELTPTTDRKIY